MLLGTNIGTWVTVSENGKKRGNEHGSISITCFGFDYRCVCGLIAGKIMGTEGSILRNVILGIIGGVVGGVVFRLLGFAVVGIAGSLISGVVGACLVIWLARLITKR